MPALLLLARRKGNQATALKKSRDLVIFIFGAENTLGSSQFNKEEPNGDH
jgi:hypothetical protein